MSEFHRARERARRLRDAALLSTIGATALLAATASGARAQVLRGTLSGLGVADAGTTSTGATGGGVLGTGLTVGTTAPGNGIAGTGLAVGTTGPGGVLGTGLGVGTTQPGSGLVGTGLTLGTTAGGGVLGTGVTVGTTQPGDGLLGTGLTLGAGGNGGRGSGGTATDPAGPSTTSQVVSVDLRLSNAVAVLNDIPLRGTNTSGLPVPPAPGADAIAAGYGASAAGTNATALGTGASAGGEGSVAIGAGASADQSNTVAVGQGVRTTRANQVAIGGANSTYTLAGLPSAASLAAQSGPTSFVTTDAGGNLAASNYGPGSIAALDGRVSSLETNVAALRRDVRGAFQGTAIALSLAGAVLPAGKAFAVSANFGTYHGETAFGATGIARLTDNLYASGGVGFATSGRASVGGRGGVTLAW